MRLVRGIFVVLLVVPLAAPPDADAYSVLAHETLIDEAWEGHIAPLLRRRFPGATPPAIRAARAYAYGGSLIQDLGYYPFGSKFFSNLVHYERSGEFVEALVAGSRDVNEFAFALGALAHYASDNAGHPIGVNRAVPLLYPKLRKKHGDEVLYTHSPSRHVMAEFAFDVLQVARGRFRADTYQDYIGFEVATRVLDEAFRTVYGLSLDDVFGDPELAINTYRRAASELIPDVTRAAWREKREEILEANPQLTEQEFVFAITPQEYDDTFGTRYRKPGLLARIVVAIFTVIPKFGPFKPLAFEPLTPDAERMFLESLAASRTRFHAALQDAGAGRLSLRDTDLDTGRPRLPGANKLADETAAELAQRSRSHQARTVAR